MKKLLVVVDMQNDFVTGVLGTAEAQSVVPAIAEYIKSYDGDVVFTRDTHKDNYMDTLEGEKLPVPHCIENTTGWEIVPELKPLSEDKNITLKIFNKPTFGSVELAEFIKDSGYELVDFCGVCTGICVISNEVTLKAFAPETRIVTHSDLCACVTPESHETALAAMKTCHIDVV